MLLVVLGVILVGLAAGFAFASYQERRIRLAVTAARAYEIDAPATGQDTAAAGYDAAARATFRRRLVVCGVSALAAVALIVAGSAWR